MVRRYEVRRLHHVELVPPLRQGVVGPSRTHLGHVGSLHLAPDGVERYPQEVRGPEGDKDEVCQCVGGVVQVAGLARRRELVELLLHELPAKLRDVRVGQPARRAVVPEVGQLKLLVELSDVVKICH